MQTKERKQEIVSELRDLFGDAQVALVADLTGLTVSEITGLRRKLDEANSKCHIAKNTLIKVATEGTDYEAIKELAVGPTAVVLGYEDPAAPAKSTSAFLKSIKKGEIRGGVLDGKALTKDEVKFLAELPSKEELLASIMGGLDSGARNIAGIFESLIRDIALMAEEVAKKNEAA